MTEAAPALAGRERSTVEVARRTRRTRTFGGGNPPRRPGRPGRAEPAGLPERADLPERAGRRVGMGRLVRAELFRIATNRWQLAALAGILLINLPPLLLWGAQADPVAAWNGLRSRSGVFVAYGLLLFAVALVTGEYRFRTVTQSWLVTPRRGRLLAAQVVTVAGIGLVMATLTFAAWWAAGAARHSAGVMRADRPAELAAAYGVVVAMVCAAAVTGVAVGTATRGLTVALAALAGCGLVEAVVDLLRFHGPVTATMGVLFWPTSETQTSSLLAAIGWAVVGPVAAAAVLRRDLPS